MFTNTNQKLSNTGQQLDKVNQKFTNTNQKLNNTSQQLDKINQKFTNEFNVWHDRLDHPGSIMMREMIENSSGHTLKCKQIPRFLMCCMFQGKIYY